MPMVLGRALTRKVQARAELAHVSAKTFGRECDRIKRPLTESICFSFRLTSVGQGRYSFRARPQFAVGALWLEPRTSLSASYWPNGRPVMKTRCDGWCRWFITSSTG